VWTFSNKQAGDIWAGAELKLYWEIPGDPITDNYQVEEITADELWGMWVDAYGGKVYYESLGAGWVPVIWFVDVTGPGDRGTFEGAPFAFRYYDAQDREDSEDFLTFFTWPTDEGGQPVRWPSLPVVDKLWRIGEWTKGGFFQEATGWKPAAYQPFVYLPALGEGARLPY
jgi:hypothetical protein